jgi:uncharacterized glyoxalase superfamily protein PhnB
MYPALNLPLPPASSDGPKLLLTFDVESAAEVDRHIQRAIELGAKLVKPAYRTYYNHYQGVLLDLEANGFRINTVL